MSTKLRMVLELDGHRYSGGNAFRALTQYAAVYKIPKKKENQPIWEHWKHVFQAVPVGNKRLWMFREPRGIKTEESRFKMLCQHFGTAAPRLGRRRPQLFDEPLVAPRARLRIPREAPIAAEPQQIPVPREAQQFVFAQNPLRYDQWAIQWRNAAGAQQLQMMEHELERAQQDRERFFDDDPR